MKVKALSFRQPWADLVLQGRKTLDLRTWSTRYRGPLAIYASQTMEKERCLEFGLDPNQLTTGAVIGIVDLVRVIELDETLYAASAGEHLSGRHFKEPMFGWEFTNPRPLAEPQPAKGRLLLFEVDLDVILSEAKDPPKNTHSSPLSSQTQPTTPSYLSPGFISDGSQPFELRILSETVSQSSYRLALYQRKVEAPSVQRSLYKPATDPMERVVELGGVALRAVADQVLEALRENGYKATDLSLNRREPFALQEEWGVRLGLLFLAVKPISKVTRIEMISSGLRDMTSEELYYWYSKCTSRAIAEHAQKALRILLSDE